MSYAVRNDGSGWRAVDGPNACAADETWSAIAPAVTMPTPLEVEALPQLTAAQAARIVAFLKDNPDILAAAQL